MSETQVTFLSFLGVRKLQRRDQDDRHSSAAYKETEYGQSPGINAFCAPHYLALHHELSRLTLAVTPGALKATFPEVHAVLRDVSCEATPLEIPDGKDSSELWETFQTLVDFIREHAPVHLDVSHGYRHLPILAMAAAQYAGALADSGRSGSRPVTAITYAAVEMASDLRYAPVLDLQPLVELFDWTRAATTFTETGRARSLAALMRAIQGELHRQGGEAPLHIAKLGAKVNALARDLLALRIESLRGPDGSAAALAWAMADDAPIHAEVDRFARPLLFLGEPIRRTAERLAGRSQLDILEWYVEHDHAAQAVALANEAVLTLLARWLGVPESDLVDHRVREEVDHVTYPLRMTRKDARLSRAAERLRATWPVLALLVDARASLGDLRNDVMHAQQRRRQSIGSDHIYQRARELPGLLRNLEAAVHEAAPFSPVGGEVALFNATLHAQDEARAPFEERGYRFVPDLAPHGKDVPVDADREAVSEMAKAIVRRAIEDGADALLVGGLGSMTIALHKAAVDAGLGVVEAATARKRDENRRFVFEPGSVRVIAPPLGVALARWSSSGSRPVEN